MREMDLVNLVPFYGPGHHRKASLEEQPRSGTSLSRAFAGDPFQLALPLFPKGWRELQRVCGTCAPPTSPTLTANQAMAQELAMGLQGLEGCHPTPAQVLEIHANYANEEGEEREKKGRVDDTCRRNAG